MNITTSFALLALAIASEILGTSALKASDGMTRPTPAVIVVASYALAFYLLALSLRTLPVGFVYAIWAGLGTVGVAIVGMLVFGEAMPATKIAGMALIVGGVVLLNLGSS